jgi:RNA polymerase subunit RPABC4/transcription elongation factor Spt4
MPVCLHCGELNADGSLFCTKCGFTLPQTGPVPAPPPPPPLVGPGVPGAAVTPPAPPPPSNWQRPYTLGTPAAFPLPAGGTGPMAPPPSGKFCIRCRTVISQSAAYCPVCQQPQSP